MSRTDIARWVVDNPKATTALFTLLLLLTQVQAVVAEGSGAHGG